MDCSGLVFNVYRTFGIALPRTSRAQARFGRKVSRSDLRPGDLIFFDTSGGRGVSHVGIYAGRGEFIHASTRSRRVKFDRLDNRYFKNRYVVARRVL
jgi:cell wall-associated NlpC family hydrolase